MNDATLLDPKSLVGAQRPAVNATIRTTVLPRVAVVSGDPSLVVTSRERFESAQVLGRGGVGEVILARDHDIDRPVAIKRLLPEFDDPGIIARFIEEIRTLGLLDHPNIVPVHDVGVDPDGRYYYVMKYVEGETLEHIIERLDAGDPNYHQRYSFDRRTEIFRQVLRALQYAHARGIIHRDIKPANVMIGRYGEVLLMDWGIARRAHEEETRFPTNDQTAALMARGSKASQARLRTAVGSLLGTPMYMSPEQARGDLDKLDERSDIYSLCVMFHELLTLRHYLASHDTLEACVRGAIDQEVPFASYAHHAHQPGVPADLGHFIRHGIAKNPGQRYRSVTEMIDRLQRIEEGHCAVECPATLMKRMGSETSNAIDRRPFVVLGGTLLVLSLALAGALALALSFSALSRVTRRVRR